MVKNLFKDHGFTIVELLIVISVIAIIAVMGAHAYSVGRRTAIIDIHAEKLTSLLHSFRDKTKADKEPMCTGMIFKKGETPQKIQVLFKNSYVGCDRTAAPVQTLLDWQNDVMIETIRIAGNDSDVPLKLLFAPPHGIIVADPEGQSFTIIIRYKDITRIIEINTAAGRIERIRRDT